MLHAGVYIAQGRVLFRRVAGRGAVPPWWRTKSYAPFRDAKDERLLVCKWPRGICYRGLVCHGAKWKRWKKANPEGSMKRFFRSREQRALDAREEIRTFWLGRGMGGGAGCSQPAPTISSSSSDASDDCTEEEYMMLMATYPSDEEILEWVLREQRARAADDFAPAHGPCRVCRAPSCAGCKM